MAETNRLQYVQGGKDVVIDGTPLKIVLSKSFNFTALVDAKKKEVFKITSDPVLIYGKWYHKILNKLTLGYRFNSGWEYSVKKVSK